MADEVDEGWSGERVARWVRQEAALERQLAPVASVLLEAAELRAGESVLDVGCGAGPTTRLAARLVGPTGRVAGLDISADMLRAAAQHPAEEGAAPIDWIEADAVRWAGEGGGGSAGAGYDVVLSRFGVMFFSDPKAAFANLAAASRPGGRLTMAVWGFREESEIFRVSLDAVLGVLPPATVIPPRDEGPFSLADPAAVRSLLSGAGWAGVDVAPHDLALPFAGGAGVDESAEAALDFGPTRLVLAGADADTKAAAKEAVAAAFEPYVDDRGVVVLQGRVHVITAVAGAGSRARP